MGLDNRISLQKLEIFCLVVELGGVGRAAEHLYVSQPVVTAHMRMLQERIGAQLLYRDGQKMRLTEVGEQVYAWATDLLSRSRELSRRIEGLADGTAGSAAIASSMSVGSYILPPLLADFQETRPDAFVRLHVSDGEDAAKVTESGDCDFAVITTATPATGGLLRSETIGHHELVLVAAPDDAVADTIGADELRRLRFVCSPGGRPRRRMVDAAMSAVGIEDRDVAIELGHPEALKTATRRGMGVSLLLRASVQPELDAGTLREIAIDETELTVPVVLLTRPGKQFTPLQGELAEHIRNSHAAIRA
jgi:DNA-binding transcriptional LysR family regulator